MAVVLLSLLFPLALINGYGYEKMVFLLVLGDIDPIPVHHQDVTVLHRQILLIAVIFVIDPTIPRPADHNPVRQDLGNRIKTDTKFDHKNMTAVPFLYFSYTVFAFFVQIQIPKRFDL